MKITAGSRLAKLIAMAGVLVLSLVSISGRDAAAQFDPGQFPVLNELSPFQNQVPDPNFAVSAQLHVAPGSRFGLLRIVATMDKSWHIYSLTQPPGGPMKSTIKLDANPALRLLGSFAPDRPAKVHFEDVFKIDVEEYSGEISWSVPVELSGDPAQITIAGNLNGQVCADQGACIPISRDDSRFVATLGTPLDSKWQSSLEGFHVPSTHGTLRGWLSHASAQPGQTVQLHLSLTPEPEWHVYAYEKLPPSMFSKPTLIHVEAPQGWGLGLVHAAAAIVSEASPIPDEPPTRYYEGPVTWTVPITVPSSANPGVIPISGHLGLQTCASTCDRPTAVAWSAELTVDAKSDAISSHDAPRLAPLAYVGAADYDAVVKLLQSGPMGGTRKSPPRGSEDASQVAQMEKGNASDPSGSAGVVGGFDPSKLKVQSEADNRSLGYILVAAFLGGFVLNFMPCVLPVIGLKILSFVDQAGANRGRVFGLNVWYSLGMLSVFLVLATLAAAPALGLSKTGFGWGQQYNYDGFSIPLICLVFVMGLSFLGVWEIPIPGFATSGKATELAAKEGFSGAFFKGIVTTILATPCSAPGLVTAYGWAVKSQSAVMAYLVFTVMGLGMAIPYLLIGAFPSLIRFLPKPGAWMDTFKQLMGFLLLGTVVFLLMNVNWQNVLPTVALLFGLWFACWWIGQVPMTASSDTRWRAWGISAVVAMISLAVAFAGQFDAIGMSFQGLRGSMNQRLTRYVDQQILLRTSVGNLPDSSPEPKPTTHSANELPWEVYSDELLQQITGSQQTVLVDFTADW